MIDNTTRNVAVFTGGSWPTGGAAGAKWISSGVVPNNLWTHIAVTEQAAYDTTGVKMYINGTPQTVTVPTNGFYNTYFDMRDPWNAFVGLNGSGASSLNGYIDDLMVWDRVLSGEEVRQLSQHRGVAYTPASRRQVAGQAGAAPPAASFTARKTFSRVIP